MCCNKYFCNGAYSCIWVTPGLEWAVKNPQLPKEARFPFSLELPFAKTFREIPVIGEIYYELIRDTIF
ncbi:MAG: hypothetical protein CM1200mP30_04320 [Pseudomonadota bacterium]|nr:MAG: hypothetical protein CM1200mP30_04320 [Pseudomonadota bacterium]